MGSKSKVMVKKQSKFILLVRSALEQSRKEIVRSTYLISINFIIGNT